MFLDFTETIAGLLLCWGVGTVQCLLNILHIR